MATFKEMVDRLIQRRAAAMAEVVRLDRLLKTLTEAEQLLTGKGNQEILESVSRQEFPDLHETETETEQGSSGGQQALQPEQITRFAREVLLEIGRPLKRGALVRAMESKGVPLTGADKAKNLGTILWRTKGAFVNLEGRGYWPADVELPNIYHPGKNN